jgi:hypothetical protein
MLYLFLLTLRRNNNMKILVQGDKDILVSGDTLVQNNFVSKHFNKRELK